MSGSRLLLRVSVTVDVLPCSKHDKSLDNFPSLRQLNRNLGVTSATEGSLCVRSSVDAEGTLKVR